MHTIIIMNNSESKNKHTTLTSHIILTKNFLDKQIPKQKVNVCMQKFTTIHANNSIDVP